MEYSQKFYIWKVLHYNSVDFSFVNIKTPAAFRTKYFTHRACSDQSCTILYSLSKIVAFQSSNAQMQEGYLICRIIYPSLQALYYLNPDSTNIAPRIILATDLLKSMTATHKTLFVSLLSSSKWSLWGAVLDQTRNRTKLSSLYSSLDAVGNSHLNT